MAENDLKTPEEPLTSRKRWWRDPTLLAGAAALLALIPPLTAGVNGLMRSRLEHHQQQFNIRLAYLDQVTKSELTPQQREMSLEFLSVTLDPKDNMQQWANQQLTALRSEGRALQSATSTRDSALAQVSLAAATVRALRDSIEAETDSSQDGREALADSLERTEAQLGQLEGVVRFQTALTDSLRIAIRNANAVVGRERDTADLHLDSILVVEDGTSGPSWWQFTFVVDGSPIFAMPTQAFDDENPNCRRCVQDVDRSIPLEATYGESVTLGVRGQEVESGQTASSSSPIAIVPNRNGRIYRLRVSGDDPDDIDFLFYFTAH